MAKLKTIIIDDSAVVREVLSQLLNADANFEMPDSASDPIFALRKMEKNWPDLIILDLEMPRMSGMDFLEKIMRERPTPVVICSTLVQDGAPKTFEALSKGALAVIPKPAVSLKNHLEESSQIILQTLKEAGATILKKKAVPLISEIIPPSSSTPASAGSFDLIAMGASTGGTQALEEILKKLPSNLPGIVIVQHMPEKFTDAFARRLNGICPMEIREAVEGDIIHRGHAFIAPGDRHMLVEKKNGKLQIKLNNGPAVGYHKPAVDVLFRSVAAICGRNALGVILTGMGRDGSKGMLEMKKQGAFNLAQDESSCVVFSMPKEAIAAGAADEILPLSAISRRITELNSCIQEKKSWNRS